MFRQLTCILTRKWLEESRSESFVRSVIPIFIVRESILCNFHFRLGSPAKINCKYNKIHQRRSLYANDRLKVPINRIPVSRVVGQTLERKTSLDKAGHAEISMTNLRVSQIGNNETKNDGVVGKRRNTPSRRFLSMLEIGRDRPWPKVCRWRGVTEERLIDASY